MKQKTSINWTFFIFNSYRRFFGVILCISGIAIFLGAVPNLQIENVLGSALCLLGLLFIALSLKIVQRFLYKMIKSEFLKILFSENSFFWPLLIFLFGLFLILGSFVFKIPKLIEKDAWMIGAGYTLVGIFAISAWIRTAILTAVRFLRYRRTFFL